MNSTILRQTKIVQKSWQLVQHSPTIFLRQDSKTLGICESVRNRPETKFLFQDP